MAYLPQEDVRWSDSEELEDISVKWKSRESLQISEDESYSKQLYSRLEDFGLPNKQWWQKKSTLLEELGEIFSPKNKSLPFTLVEDEGFKARLSFIDDDLACLSYGAMRGELFQEMVWDHIRGLKNTRVLSLNGVQPVILVIEYKSTVFRIKYFQCRYLAESHPEVVDADYDTLPQLETEAGQAALALKVWNHFPFCKLMGNKMLRPLFCTFRAVAVLMGLCPDGPEIEPRLCNVFLDVYMRSGNSVSDGRLVSNMLVELSDLQSKLSVCTADQASRILTISDFQGFEQNGPLPLYDLINSISRVSNAEKFRSPHHVVISMNYYGQVNLEIEEMFDFVSKSINRLMIDFGRLGYAHVVLRPQRFASTVPAADNLSWEGFHLIGLTIDTGKLKALDKDLIWNTQYLTGSEVKDNELFASTVDKFNRYTEHRISTGKKQFSLHASILSEFDSNTSVDTKRYGRPTVPDPYPEPPTQAVPISQANAAAQGPLRPSHEVLNQLRHDPALDIFNYCIGFGDFGRLNFKNASSWQTESTAEVRTLQYFIDTHWNTGHKDRLRHN